MAIRCRLSEILGKRRMHILELKRETGVAYSTLHRLYHEKATMVSLRTIDAVCQALDITPGELFEYVEKGKKPVDGPMARLIKNIRAS